MIVDHQGAPTHPEVRQICGESVYQDWVSTGPCDDSVRQPSDCEGLYLHLQDASPATRTFVVDLPKPTVSISLEGCNPQPNGTLCTGRPVLVLTGYEPLSEESIVRIHGMLAGLPFTCPSDRCELPLHATSRAGSDLVFWADSTYGDASEHYTALFRALPEGDGPSLRDGSYVDVLSSQWRGTEPASCSLSWQALPPPGGLPEWLATPSSAEQLETEEPYALLAGRLISNGLADADQCPGGGLLDSGGASPCGLDASRPAVVDWQNRFDQRILIAAHAKGAPARLIKNLFAIESQLWPGYDAEEREAGFGHLTEEGADTVFLWGPGFYDQFCPQVLEPGVCAGGYVHLLPGEQAMLRGALVTRVSASCPSCPGVIDLDRADFSVEVFAEVLLANCEQVGRMVRNTTGERPGQAAEFEDLWRFTVSNYNAGPGCLSSALRSAWIGTGQLTWAVVSGRFPPACRPVVEYVERVAGPPP